MNWGHIAPTAPDTLGSCLRNSLPFYAKAKLEAWGEQGECWFKQFFCTGYLHKVKPQSWVYAISGPRAFSIRGLF